MIIENPPSPAQLQRLEQENKPILQAQNNQTDQDLINALLLQKITELEKKIASQSFGDSADV